jgi:hypothetical protein
VRCRRAGRRAGPGAGSRTPLSGSKEWVTNRSGIVRNRIEVRSAHAWGNGHNNGNGTHNKTTISYDSPTINHGIQHVTASNAGGNAVVQNAFCKKRVRLCKIREHLIINDP